MPTTVVIEPPRISDKPAHDTATVKLSLDVGLRAWQVRVGRVVRRGGIVCGRGDRCGPTARSLALPPNTVVGVPVSYAQLAPVADGDLPGEVTTRAV